MYACQPCFLSTLTLFFNNYGYMMSSFHRYPENLVIKILNCIFFCSKQSEHESSRGNSSRKMATATTDTDCANCANLQIKREERLQIEKQVRRDLNTTRSNNLQLQKVIGISNATHV